MKTPVGVEAAAEETPSLTGEFVGDPQGPRMYTGPPTQEAAPEGPNLTVGSEGSERKMYREPIVMGRKLELKSMVWTRRKKETSNQKRMKRQEFGKMRRGLGTSRTS